jgi:hypothetical protein
MTERDEVPTPSLIQQRMEIDRARIAAVWMTVTGVFFLIGSVAQFAASAGSSFAPWYLGVIALPAIVIGVVQIVRARARMARFEEQHGAGAGRRER